MATSKNSIRRLSTGRCSVGWQLAAVGRSRFYCSHILAPIDTVEACAMLPRLYVKDWLYLENYGAYSTVLITQFNGFQGAEVGRKNTRASAIGVSVDDAYKRKYARRQAP